MILQGLRGVVESFALPGGIRVERRSTATFDADGNPVRGTSHVRTVKPAVVHVASGRDLLRLPEGDRTKEAIVVFTHERLRTARESTTDEADVVLYGSQGSTGRYVVTTSEDWTAQSGHYRCIALREEDG